MISQIAGVPGTRAAEALRTLARLHGTWWNAPLLDELDWMPRLDEPINLAAGQQYRDAWPVFLERIGDDLGPDALALGERTQRVFEDLLRDGIAEAPVTVCHGDFRADNLMFDDRADPADEVAVLDWQISYRGPAITDVAYFLCQSLTVEERRAHEADLVRGWYDELAATVRAGARDDARRLPVRPRVGAVPAGRRSAPRSTPVSAMGAMDVANERGRELVTSMAVRSFTAALDLEAGAAPARLSRPRASARGGGGGPAGASRSSPARRCPTG